MNTKATLVLFLALSLVVGLAGCDDSGDVNDVQYIEDVAWLPDGSGMLALVERSSQTAVALGATDAYNLYRIGSDGHIGEQISLPSPVTLGNYDPVLVSSDGSDALLSSGTDIVSVDLASSASTIRIQNADIIVTDPTLHYVLTTTNGNSSFAKVCTLYDISALPARIVSKFNAINVTSGRGLWIGNGEFALTHLDSTGQAYLNVYDTTGHIVQSIPDAEVAFHASAFAAGSNALFVRDHLDHIVKITLPSGQRTTITNESILSMDASADGRLVTYITADTLGNRSLFLENVSTGAAKQIASDPITVYFSPTADRVAFVHYIDPYNEDLQVTAITPP